MMRVENRRWSTRVAGQLPVRCRASSAQFQKSQLLNISYSGARLVLRKAEAEAGPYLEMELDLHSQSRFLGRKAWQRRIGNDSYVVGVNFIRPTTKARAELALYIAERLRTRYNFPVRGDGGGQAGC